jgi:hypothetical protein
VYKAQWAILSVYVSVAQVGITKGGETTILPV